MDESPPVVDRRAASTFDASVPGILALSMTVLVGVMVLIVLLVGVPKENETLVTQVVTGVLGAYAVILAYYFSTTRTSGKKDETIQALANTAQRAGEALVPLAGSSADINLKPGETATATATSAGTTIEKEPQP